MTRLSMVRRVMYRKPQNRGDLIEPSLLGYCPPLPAADRWFGDPETGLNKYLAVDDGLVHPEDIYSPDLGRIISVGSDTSKVTKDILLWSPESNESTPIMAYFGDSLDHQETGEWITFLPKKIEVSFRIETDRFSETESNVSLAVMEDEEYKIYGYGSPSDMTVNIWDTLNDSEVHQIINKGGCFTLTTFLDEGEWNSAPPPKLLRLTIYGLQYSQIILKGVKFFDVNPESG